MKTKPITVVETSVFTRRADKILGEEGRKAVIDFLANNPLAGDEIPETGGVRKVRISARGKGKSGGARVIYYYLDDDMPLFALLIYGKDEQDDMTAEQKKIVSKLAASIKGSHRRRKVK
ncbi:type II toxin-antitoxin system RelE/ParE family toxin [Skermanella aerolata]|nr:type II toxin-antitoxin system RelE/ParE family toxin [Skermanella aerolata]